MFVDRAELGEPTNQERRDSAQSDSRVLGRVIQCDGARAVLSAYADDTAGANGLWTVGRMVSINLGVVRTVAVLAIGLGSAFFVLTLLLGTPAVDGFVFAVGVPWLAVAANALGVCDDACDLGVEGLDVDGLGVVPLLDVRRHGDVIAIRRDVDVRD